MIRTNYHTHNRFCDGKGEIVEYVDAALSAGFEALGISSHAPLVFPDENAMRAELLPAYCAEVERLRAAYQGRLRVHLSLEFDYIPERLDELWAVVSPHQFDYLIGSVHFVGVDATGVPWPYDLTRRGFERGLRMLYGGDIRRLVVAYYERVRTLAAWGRAAIVGHIDRIKMWNRDSLYFNEDDVWYRREVTATLKACAQAHVIVELNTTGWRHAARTPYPSPWVLRQCLDMGIPVIVTTDAHTPSRVTEFHGRAEALLRELGCTELAVLRDGGWRVEPF
jgi:histidinol-phosphatase (PHP family)